MLQNIFGFHDPVKDLLQELFKNPLAKKLYDDAQRIHIAFEKRPFTIELVDGSKLAGFDAMSDFEHYCIQILDNQPFTMQLTCLIFELTNFLQLERHEATCARLVYGRYPMRRITYIKLREKIEYDGCKIHHRVVRYGIKNLNWDPDMDEYDEVVKSTFEERFANIHEDHKEFFGKDWETSEGPHKRRKT